MNQEPYILDRARRAIVLAAVSDACTYRNWCLAVHVRTNHVHVVVEAPVPAEKVLNVLKARASRLLNESGFDAPGRQRWSRHGSTRPLGSQSGVAGDRLHGRAAGRADGGLCELAEIAGSKPTDRTASGREPARPGAAADDFPILLRRNRAPRRVPARATGS